MSQLLVKAEANIEGTYSNRKPERWHSEHVFAAYNERISIVAPTVQVQPAE